MVVLSLELMNNTEQKKYGNGSFEKLFHIRSGIFNNVHVFIARRKVG
jgi:hypothetical protein